MAYFAKEEEKNKYEECIIRNWKIIERDPNILKE
jgi:hypothetical protein